MTDQLTLLKCVDHGAIATKKIVAMADGVIDKQSFSAGKFFRVRQVPVNDIWTLGAAIKQQETIKNEVLIRGEPLPNLPHTVMRRKVGGEGGAFVEKPRYWLMLDIDDFPLPSWINPADDPEAAVKWVRSSLPTPFRKATCYYQFSSGQNLPKKLGDEPPHIAKLHLFFWLDRALTSEQLRNYMNAEA